MKEKQIKQLWDQGKDIVDILYTVYGYDNGKARREIKQVLGLSTRARVKKQKPKTQEEEKIEFKQELLNVFNKKEYKPIKIVATNEKVNRVAFLVASDWHIEEKVEADKIHGLNEFNLDIARKRVSKFFENGVKLIKKNEEVKDIVLCFNGDLISGHLHEELMEDNFISPPKAIWECYGMIRSGIDYMLSELNYSSIKIVCTVGNHGRTTAKKRIGTAVDNSFEWLMFKMLENAYEDEQRIDFNIPSGKMVYYDVFGFTIRQCHGDQIGGGQGIGGIAVPVIRKVLKWDNTKQAHLTILGHFHQFVTYKNVMVNGCLVGYNAFAEEIGAQFEEPTQTFFILDSKKGKTTTCPIFLD